MVLFFFVVGLEIRREVAMGELTERGRAAIPAAAALAGMVVPALIYLAINAGGEGARGWGIVMATDIAFVLGLLALLGPSAPASLRVFLLTLAIIDDIGAILVIAVFYSDDISLLALVIAAAVVPIIFLINRVRIWRGPAYLIAGLVMWVAMHESGVHPTIAGVILGVLTAVYPPQRGAVERAARLSRSFRQSRRPRSRGPRSSRWPTRSRPTSGCRPCGTLDELRDRADLRAGQRRGRAQRRHPGRRAGLGGDHRRGPRARRRHARGHHRRIAGRRAPRPGLDAASMSRMQLSGGAALAGIGFTAALFITDLAFDDPVLRDQAKVGVLIASLVAALIATVLFRVAARRDGPGGGEPDRPTAWTARSTPTSTTSAGRSALG
jgi:hypothetical protein